MPYDDTALAAVVYRHIPAVDVKVCRVYYDAEIKDMGDLVRVGLHEVRMPFRGIQVFVDLMPNANWGHHVTYLLVSDDLTQCVPYQEQFPPFSGDVPDRWRELALVS
jgi:hypothetical protein